MTDYVTVTMAFAIICAVLFFVLWLATACEWDKERRKNYEAVNAILTAENKLDMKLREHIDLKHQFTLSREEVSNLRNLYNVARQEIEDLKDEGEVVYNPKTNSYRSKKTGQYVKVDRQVKMTEMLKAEVAQKECREHERFDITV